MNRTKLILTIFMLGNVVAHGDVLLEPQIKTQSQRHGFSSMELTTPNSAVLAHDAVFAPTLSREWKVDQSNLVAKGGSASNLNAASAITQAPADFGRNGRSDLWLIAVASIGLVAWQLWRKQKSLRFDQSCLAKDTDYALH